MEVINKDLNNANTYAQNQKMTTEISWGYNVKGGLGKNNTHRAYQGKKR